MLIHFVLLADIGEVIGASSGWSRSLLWVIQQIAEANKQAGRRSGRPQVAPAAASRRQPRQARRAAGGSAGRSAAQPGRRVLAACRARPQAEQPASRRSAAPQPAASEIEVLLDDESALPAASRLGRAAAADATSRRLPQRQPRRADKRPTASLGDATQAQDAWPSTWPTNVAARTRSDLAEQASNLGQRIIDEDQQFDVQLKAKFDHTVGTLAGSDGRRSRAGAASRSDSPAAQIAAMLASPDGVRQAIVLNEILRRPSDRW